MRINFPAVLVAAIVYWLLGFLWYGVIFARKFVEIMNYSPQQLAEMEKSNHVGELMLTMLSGFFVMLALAYILKAGRVHSTANALKVAVVVFLGFMLATSLETVLFESRALGLYLINNSYHLVGLIFGALILSTWRKKVIATVVFEE
jgi:hypothetical protein